MNRLRIVLSTFMVLSLFCKNSHEETSYDGLGVGVGKSGNLRVCIVEGKGLYKKAGRYCPVLEKNNAHVECVIGTDRLDCLRRISKGTVDFGVFTSEDLLAARWANIDILVTDELRFHKDPFEYEIVALVDDRSNIEGIDNLKGARFCHPGHGYEADWTDTLANFFESKVIPKSCDPTISLMENRLKDTATFFSGVCKAGPWVSDPSRDRVLKSLYPGLCNLCYDQRCSVGDKFWGRRGPLNCLTEESGNVAWARLDDVRTHFGLVNITPTANPDFFSYLCPDGTKRSLKSTQKPCIWLSKPWPVIAAKRKVAETVSNLVRNLNHDKLDSWESALLSLIEFYHVIVYPLKPQMAVVDYLDRAVGFQSANSFADCNPPRSITICTENIIERFKCNWLAETARAHGVEPQIHCINDVINEKNMDGKSPEEVCFEAIKSGRAEVTVGHPDWQVIAKRDHGIEPVLFESSLILNDLYVVVAVVKTNSTLKSFESLRGKKACFPKYEGVAWYSLVNYLKLQKIISSSECPYEKDIEEFFDSACVPGISKDYNKLTKLCGSHEEYVGEIGALKCLMDDVADVAFISMRTLKNHTDAQGVDVLPHNFNPGDYREICPMGNEKSCYISWSSIGQIYTLSNSSRMRKQEIVNTFKQLDQLFGKNLKSHTNAFTMYGPFDHNHDVLFQDRTKYLKTKEELSEIRYQYNYETMVNQYDFGKCKTSGAGLEMISRTTMGISLIVIYFMF